MLCQVQALVDRGDNSFESSSKLQNSGKILVAVRQSHGLIGIRIIGLIERQASKQGHFNGGTKEESGKSIENLGFGPFCVQRMP